MTDALHATGAMPGREAKIGSTANPFLHVQSVAMNTSPAPKESGLIRVKFASVDAEAGIFEGYGAIFGNVDLGGDMILPGAFAASLAEHKAAGTTPVLLWSHKMDEPIGRWLDMREDGIGLYVKGQINLDTVRGRDAHSHIVKGDVSGLSIGYRIPPGGSEITADGRIQRIKTASLYEISVVTIPMNPKARIKVDSKSDLEELLVKSGLAKEAAKRVAYGGWPALSKQTEQPNFAALVEAVTKSARRI